MQLIQAMMMSARPPLPRGLPPEPEQQKLLHAEYGTFLSMQRTTMAYVRTAVSITGLGRTSSSAAVQYSCDAAALLMLIAGVAQHWSFGSAMISSINQRALDGAGSSKSLAPADPTKYMPPRFFGQAAFFHHALLLLGVGVAGMGALAASVWMEKLPEGANPFAGLLLGLAS